MSNQETNRENFEIKTDLKVHRMNEQYASYLYIPVCLKLNALFEEYVSAALCMTVFLMNIAFYSAGIHTSSTLNTGSHDQSSVK